ncbi:MAG: O-acetyl-ADP-ribose deacetylase [Desulfuromonas sp.]|nr:MAG: O-acetyl-ADP-ribose deacetylase [Desulfuromonas sp.]
MKRIEIIKADITQLNVDAIVNTATTKLLGGGGVDGAIHDAAGPELMDECRRLKGCVVGTAKITSGYNLPARYVIHTVGPQWDGGVGNEEALLASCYRECFKLARTHGCKTLAFPAISCGAYQFPIPTACEIALEVAAQCLDGNDQIEQVYFVCYRDAVERSMREHLVQMRMPLVEAI